MMLTIKDFKIEELPDYIESEDFQKLEDLPISKHRALSYIQNPRANKKDIAFSLLYDEKKLIAYCCLYSDYFFFENRKFEFAWLSGSWVHPDYRRQGHSMTLLKHGFDKKAGRLMFSNYAPEAKRLFLKSGFFSEAANIKGRRFYFRFSFAELLPPKHVFFKKIKPVLFFLDSILNLLFDNRFLFYRLKPDQLQFKEVESFDQETNQLIENQTISNPFKRSVKELNHAEKYAWVAEKKYPNEQDKKYFFSSFAKRFKYIKLKLFKEGKFSALLILKVRNKTLTIPYAYINDYNPEKIANIILYYIKKFKITHLTIFNSIIADALLKQKRLIIASRKMYKRFFATHVIAEKIKTFNVFFDGDGDSLYT